MAQLAGLFAVSAQENSISDKANSGPPALPISKPPIEYFRELLVMPMAERERSIAEKSEAHKKILRSKLKEYEAMTSEERELRLAVTELRWYLVPLMKITPAEREERMKAIPEEIRALVEDRLRRWDALSSDQQKDFLENEMTVRYFLRLQSSTPEQQENLLQLFPADRREKLERDLARWRSLPADQRSQMNTRFEQFFELDVQEKAKTLGTLSQAERAQMEKTLDAFKNLPPEQRKHCIESFSKLAHMNRYERMEFLRKAEAWEKMSPSDREAWRELVHKLPQMPPLPPGLRLGPPLPPSPLLATNRVDQLR